MRLASTPPRRHLGMFGMAFRRISLPGRMPVPSIDHRSARVDRSRPIVMLGRSLTEPWQIGFAGIRATARRREDSGDG
jgi:hypothetical protein